MLTVGTSSFQWPKPLSIFLYWMATEQEDRPWQSSAQVSRDLLETDRGGKREKVKEDGKTKDLRGLREGFLIRLRGCGTQVTNTDLHRGRG